MNLPDHRYSGTESTRLLCAGVYQDAAFRRRVVEELVDHRERPVAPPNGIDVLPVLSHALRVTRQEARAALMLLGVWAGFFASDVIMFWDSLSDRAGPDADIDFDMVLTAFSEGDDRLTGGMPIPWSFLYALVCLALWFAHRSRGGGRAARAVGLPDPVAKAADRAGSLVSFGAWALALFYWVRYVTGVLGGDVQTPYPLIFPLAMALVVWWYQTWQRRQVCHSLARWTFRGTPQPDLPGGPLYEMLRDDIRREQEASLTLYDPDSPFVGLGEQGTPWSFVMELRRRPGEEGKAGAGRGVPKQGGAGPLTADAALDMIEPQLTGLRESVALTGKDRLRDLETDRFVFLPGGVARDERLEVGGTADPATAPRGDASRRGLPVYDPAQVLAHRREAVDEGGEGRRVFLRVRVGAWHEQVVVTVLVRVHTQGRMLFLEVLPFMLGPIRKDFRAVDRFVERLPESWGKGAVRALRDGPAIGVDAGIGGFATARDAVTVGWSDRTDQPDVPRVSLRELVSTDGLSGFQRMDASRYVKTIQERIVNGVREALKSHGYRTEEFEQHVYHLSGGSVFIKDMSGGAVATGSHGSATHHTAPPPPPAPAPALPDDVDPDTP
ncbi:hypothetical protein ACFWNK_03370 [Streptomyces sp. NPDC058417]|uniref:hypothetical protein n=1 Tax=unclassified Streptomyces TaxID=2593676 RepID=UPI00365A2398